jgi:hypothetical protein
MEDEGFNPMEVIEQLNIKNREQQIKNQELAGALTSRGLINQEQDNLIYFQLETDKILERIEHFLKGDQIKFVTEGEDKGSSYYSEPTKNVLCVLKKDPKTKIIYYFQEIKENKKGTEVQKEVLVKISNNDGDEVMIREGDTKMILNKLKGIKLTNQGYKYAEIIDENKKPLNEYGVSEMMRIISMYVTKETCLSFYSEERINEILADLGDELNNFLYCNYEKMGMDTKFKESKYKLIVLNVLHVVESCYRRALNGNEQDNLRTRAIVTQNQGINTGGFEKRIPMRKKWNPLKPSTW